MYLNHSMIHNDPYKPPIGCGGSQSPVTIYKKPILDTPLWGLDSRVLGPTRPRTLNFAAVDEYHHGSSLRAS
jgi:hypothetical protein